MPALADGTPAVTRPRLLPRTVSNSLYVEAVLAFLRGHEPTVIRQLLNVTAITCAEIMASDEWAWACDSYRTEMQRGELALMTRNINKALQQCIVRLEEGDPVLVKFKDGTARITYAPIKAKDAAAIASVLMDRRDRLERKLGGEAPSDPLEDLERLANIAGKLRAVMAPAAPSNVIDIIPKLDAIDLDVHDGE